MTEFTSEFLPLIQDMVREDSGQRISMEEAHRRFLDIAHDLARDKLQRRRLNVKFLGYVRVPIDSEDARKLREFAATAEV